MRERLILSDAQADAIRLDRIAAFFTSDLYRQLKAAKEVHREFKFSMLVPAGEYYMEAADFPDEQVLLQGVIDCLLETEEGLVVVDFKTDRVSGQWAQQRAEQYRGQLDSYRRAAETVFHKPVRGCALFFLHCGKTIWLM